LHSAGVWSVGIGSFRASILDDLLYWHEEMELETAFMNVATEISLVRGDLSNVSLDRIDRIVSSGFVEATESFDPNR